MATTTITHFDYNQVDGETKGRLSYWANEFRKSRRQSVEKFFEQCRIIADAREELSGAGRDGAFKPWVELECGVDQSHAYKMIAVDERLSGSADLFRTSSSPTALIELAAKATPDAAINEAEKAVKQCQQLTVKRVKELREKYTVEVDVAPTPETEIPVPEPPTSTITESDDASDDVLAEDSRPIAPSNRLPTKIVMGGPNFEPVVLYGDDEVTNNQSPDADNPQEGRDSEAIGDDLNNTAHGESLDLPPALRREADIQKELGILQQRIDGHDWPKACAKKAAMWCLDKLTELLLEDGDEWSGLPESLDTDGFRDAWMEWISYRIEAGIRQPKYTPKGRADQWKRLAEMGEQQAMSAMENSRTQGYQGIHPADKSPKSDLNDQLFEATI